LFISRADRAARREERRSRRRGYLLRIVLALAIVVAALVAATARWFVWPPQQAMPAHVDAIVMLNGPGDRLDTALALARAHRAPMIVIPAGSQYQRHGSACAPKVPGITVICFDPNPSTTLGVEESASRLEKEYHWQSIVLVAVTPQDTPARIWAGRCFSGKTYMVNAPLPALDWPSEIARQWGSTIKAFFSPRSC